MTTTPPSPADRAPLPRITVVTFSGHQQPEVRDSPNLRTWGALADRLGHACCVWSGPRLVARRGPLRVVQRPRRPGPHSLLWAAGSVRIGVRLARAAARRGETVLLNGAEPWGWLSASIVSLIVRRPWLMEIHGDYLHLPAASLGRWRRAVLKRAVVFFAHHAGGRRVVARSMLDALDRRGIPSVLVPPRLLPVWEHRLERDRPPLSDTRAPRLLTVGRLVSSKGYDLLLEALAELVRTHPGLRLRVVGDGPLRGHVVEEAARLGLSGHVEFLGARDVDEIRAELARADLFVISSRDEGLPRTLLEAASAEVPLVATSVGGIPAACADWDGVRLVPPDSAAIASAVRRAIESPPSAEQLVAVRSRVLAEYGFDTNIDALAALFRSVCVR
ncbi:glycosyltransferase family 4 protein [Streptomyces sp. MUM 178J]|uniref:glycosyltransferase family 4 protein n=1 Tax=Streptomyces sp. MUM 178J TaxID=2791991 RepID=UPI001F03E8DB|nr:glycosyltransferase family 4 protein [Streptomyces sp. MUM 178J]WRQ82216.1 glycosyltransferase family 4 protein [Streptomyces sp. MUM 178J]